MPQTAQENTAALPPPGKLLTSAEVITLAEFATRRAEKLVTVIEGIEDGISKRGTDAGFSPSDQESAARKVAKNSEEAR